MSDSNGSAPATASTPQPGIITAPSAADVAELASQLDGGGAAGVAAEILAAIGSSPEQPLFREAARAAWADGETAGQGDLVSAERALAGFVDAFEQGSATLSAKLARIQADRHLSDEGKRAEQARARQESCAAIDASSAGSAKAFQRLLGETRARAEAAFHGLLATKSTLTATEKHEAVVRFLSATANLDAANFARAFVRFALPSDWACPALEAAAMRLADNSGASAVAWQMIEVGVKQVTRERARAILISSKPARIAAARLRELDQLERHYKTARVLLGNDSSHAAGLRAQLEARRARRS